MLLAVVFLAGGVGGALVSRVSMAQVSAKATPERYWKEGGKEISLAKFKKELDLSPQQATEIESVLDDFVMYYQSVQVQMDEVRSNGKSRIVQVLRPDQQKRFEQMMSELSKQLR